MDSIVKVLPTSGLPAPASPTSPGKGEGGDFGSIFAKAIDGVNAAQKRAETLQREFQMENPEVGLEETVIAAQKANIHFQALVQARNKIVAAYQEIMNMPV
jgi:flagellar hook-basal body complex protein FliE